MSDAPGSSTVQVGNWVERGCTVTSGQPAHRVVATDGWSVHVACGATLNDFAIVRNPKLKCTVCGGGGRGSL